MMNLRESLLQSKKPKHQFHDKASVQWIADNRPVDLLKNYQLSREIVREVEKLEPWKIIDDSWFTNSLIRDGIHGFRHCCRVAIYAVSLLMNNCKDISRDEIESLIFAGLLHDCRRINDNADTPHGRRAAVWLVKNKKIIPEHLNNFFPAIWFSIFVHNDSYKHIEKLSAYKEFKIFVDILKTADALDRYRFPRSDWWISPKFIFLKPTTQDMSFAFDLVLRSEKLFLETKNNSESLLVTWKHFK